MGLKRVRIDSIKELNKKKTNEQLAEENEQLKEQVTALADHDSARALRRVRVHDWRCVRWHESMLLSSKRG